MDRTTTRETDCASRPWRCGRGRLLPSGFCRYHNAEGTPVINAGKFPDMLNMTSWAHALGLTAGWYG